MDGKQAFKKINSPTDLFSLPHDPKSKVLTGTEGEAYLKSIAKQK